MSMDERLLKEQQLNFMFGVLNYGYRDVSDAIQAIYDYGLCAEAWDAGDTLALIVRDYMENIDCKLTDVDVVGAVYLEIANNVNSVLNKQDLNVKEVEVYANYSGSSFDNVFDEEELVEAIVDSVLDENDLDEKLDSLKEETVFIKFIEKHMINSFQEIEQRAKEILNEKLAEESEESDRKIFKKK